MRGLSLGFRSFDLFWWHIAYRIIMPHLLAKVIYNVRIKDQLNLFKTLLKGLSFLAPLLNFAQNCVLPFCEGTSFLGSSLIFFWNAFCVKLKNSFHFIASLAVKPCPPISHRIFLPEGNLEGFLPTRSCLCHPASENAGPCKASWSLKRNLHSTALIYFRVLSSIPPCSCWSTTKITP